MKIEIRYIHNVTKEIIEIPNFSPSLMVPSLSQGDLVSIKGKTYQVLYSDHCYSIGDKETDLTVYVHLIEREK